MKPRAWPPLRILLVGLGLVHMLPASKHLAALAAQPSFGDAWKGPGAAVAVILYFLPPVRQARLLGALARRGRLALSIAGFVLVAVHLVPALDHVPAFVRAPSFGDGWRALGTTIACLWFALPVALQGRCVAALRAPSPRAPRVRPA